MYARVIVDIKNKEVNRHFDYIIPNDFLSIVKKGMRVVVPFHRQIRLGYVTQLLAQSENASKEIIEVLDDIPTINEETFHIIDHIYQQTHDIYASIFETVVPNQIQLKYKKEIKIVNKDLIDDDFLKLFNTKGILRLKKSNHQYDYKINKYQKLNAIEVKQIYEQNVKEKEITVYTYNYGHSYQRIKKYKDLIESLSEKSYIKDELIDLGFSSSNIQTLVKHDVFIKSKTRMIRDVKHMFKLKDKQITLTTEQEEVYAAVKKCYDTYQPILLKGVTGSGKTEIYLNIIKDMIENQKQVLILVPEITLIAPMAQRLKSRFEGVTIYHSALSSGERFDAYTQAKNHAASIVLGTRSAVFLSFKQLGAIIIDESHDQSYVQTDHVIYDAVEIAKLRANYNHIPILLGSATPKVSRYYDALNGKYKLLLLNERPFGIKQPHIELIDMRKELKEGNTSMFSKALKTAILDRLNKKEQVMILFNRKGFSPFVMCRTCSLVPTCPNCGVALTYYKSEQMLKCHYCGHSEPFEKVCKSCGSKAIKEVGAGIELVETMLKRTFPKAKVMRMDANLTQHKGAHEALWHQFNEAQADILLGTQMIAKGLDFPKVTLVGVLMADMLLNTPTYQASEQAYMLLTQVAGRSGRFLPGDVYIQGYNLEHYAIQNTKASYDDFYKHALHDRKISSYEPFKRVSQILCEGPGYLKTYQEAYRLKIALEKYDKHLYILGPVPAYIKKVKERYRFIITMKYDQLDKKIFEIMDEMRSRDLSLKFYPNLEIV